MAVQSLGKAPLFVFIDALDECPLEEIKDMVDFCQDDLTRAAQDSSTIFRVFLSSRHYPHLNIHDGAQIVLENQEEHTDDILKYIVSKTRWLGRTEAASNLQQDILHRSSGIFLWVVLVIKLLSDADDRGDIISVSRHLQQLPTGLQDLLHDMLVRQSSEGRDLMSCVQWVLFARRPLKLEELYEALVTMRSANKSHVRSTVTMESDMEKHVLASSKGLLERAREEPRSLQFIHESVRELFLSGQALELDGYAPVDTFVPRSHHTLCSICWEYLLLATKGMDLDDREAVSLAPDHKERFPFLQYCATGVVQHSELAARSGYSHSTIVPGFDVRVWVSCYNASRNYTEDRFTKVPSLIEILTIFNAPYLIQAHIRANPELLDPWVDPRLNPVYRALELGQYRVVEAIISGFGYSYGTDDDDRPTEKITAGRAHGLLASCSSVLIHLAFAFLQLFLHSESRENINQEVRGCRGTLLGEAVRVGSLPMVQDLLQIPGIDVNVHTSPGITPLTIAAESGNIDIIRELLSAKGVRIDTSDSHGPLHAAASAGRLDSCKLLLSHKELKFIPDTDPSVLAQAASNGHLDVVMILCQQDNVDVNKDNPLHEAVRGNHCKTVSFLLSLTSTEPMISYEASSHSSASWKDFSPGCWYRNGHRVNVHAESHNGETALDTAIDSGSLPIIGMLMCHDDLSLRRGRWLNDPSRVRQWLNVCNGYRIQNFKALLPSKSSEDAGLGRLCYIARLMHLVGLSPGPIFFNNLLLIVLLFQDLKSITARNKLGHVLDWRCQLCFAAVDSNMDILKLISTQPRTQRLEYDNHDKPRVPLTDEVAAFFIDLVRELPGPCDPIDAVLEQAISKGRLDVLHHLIDIDVCRPEIPFISGYLAVELAACKDCLDMTTAVLHWTCKKLDVTFDSALLFNSIRSRDMDAVQMSLWHLRCQIDLQCWGGGFLEDSMVPPRL